MFMPIGTQIQDHKYGYLITSPPGTGDSATAEPPYRNLLANPSTARSISTGAGGHPATARSTGITLETRPQLA
jgi:hypothetical protein